MLFADVSHGELAACSYINHKLEDLVTCLQNARYLLKNAVNTSTNKLLQNPLNILAEETLQCESELVFLMHSTYEGNFTKPIQQHHQHFHLGKFCSLSSVALYCEHVYVEKYMQLVSDKFISTNINDLLKQHINTLTSALKNINFFVSKGDEQSS